MAASPGPFGAPPAGVIDAAKAAVTAAEKAKQEALAEAEKLKSNQTVEMTRPVEFYPNGPHTANVHKSQVQEWINQGWIVK